MSNRILPSPSSPVKEMIDRFMGQIDSNNIRALQPLFINIVEEIFGLGRKSGLKLNEIEYYNNPIDYDAVFKFLHPEGAFFKLCYKLIYEANAHYEYPIHDLPFNVQQEIKSQSSCSSYYRQKLCFREETLEPAFFLLNPFEYYMYYFIAYLVLFDKKSAKSKREVHQKSTVYLRLCEEYISVFLPVDDKPVKPLMKCPVTVHIGDTRPILPRTSSILRTDLASKLLDTHDTCENPEEDIWRSYLIAHVAIDFWGSTPSEKSLMHKLNYECFPSATNIYAFRYLLKHLHMFSNSAGSSSSKMDEFKRGAIALFQPKIYTFLKGTMLQWPYDSSFSLILETWLTFIQPWRYSVVGNVLPTGMEGSLIHRKWMKFISDNFLFYTYIFQLIMKRFVNLNLLLQKNTSMLLRLLTVYARGNLSLLVEEIELRYVQESAHKNSKWADSITNHICSVETPEFLYLPLFSPEYLDELEPFLKMIYHTRNEAMKQTTKLKFSSQSDVPLFKQLFFFSSESQDQDETGDCDRLTSVLQLFSTFFHFCLGDFEKACAEEGDARADIYSKRSKGKSPYFSRTSSFCGDPDIQPIRSFEIGPLIKILYRISTVINEQYGDFIICAYNGEGYFAKLARTLLAAPQEISVIDKSRGINKPLIEKRLLPPRISLRILGHKLIYIYFTILTVICQLIGIPFGTLFTYIAAALIIFVLLRPLFTS